MVDLKHGNVVQYQIGKIPVYYVHAVDSSKGIM